MLYLRAAIGRKQNVYDYPILPCRDLVRRIPDKNNLKNMLQAIFYHDTDDVGKVIQCLLNE